MRAMRRERRKTVERKQVILDIISEKQPIKTMDLFKEACAKIGENDKLSQSTFFYYLSELEQAGVIEKTALGWQLNRRGLLRRDRLNYLTELVKDQKLIESGYADIFGNFDDSFLEERVKEIFNDLVQKAIQRFYLQAGFCFQIMRSGLDQELSKLSSFQLLQDFARSVGYAVWMGYCLSLERARVSVMNLWELVMKLVKDEKGVKKLSTFAYYGLRRIFHQDSEVLAFAKVLWRVGFWGDFVVLFAGLHWVTEVFSHINDYPSEREMAKISKLLHLFIEWLRGHKLTIIIPISAESLISAEGKHAVAEFEAWFTALREGRLDHRSWIFTRGKQLLEKLITQLKKLESQELKAVPLEVLEQMRPELYEVLIEPIDAQENWILEDLFEHHPRGRDIAFYRELLGEIEKRLDANPDLRRTLET